MDKIIDILNKKLGTRIKELSEQYRKLKTDEERVIFTSNVMRDYYIIPNATGMPKDAKKSEELRENGNKTFVKGGLDNMTCVDALKLYTKSIAFAPYPSEQLALAYANRSAVLFQLGLHLECVLDIDRALAFNYPDNLKAKLYIRKAECLMILESCSTEDTLKEAQHWLEMSQKDANQEKLRAKLNVLHRKTVQIKPNVQNPLREAQIKESPLPTIIPQNNEVPCASDAVAIKYNKRYGRHVVATRNIRPGEVIAVEKPYSMMLTQENMQTHCSNCLRVCWANIPCNYCTYAMYCSEECKYAEWKKCHDVECAVFPCLVERSFLNLDFFSLRLAILAVREAGSIQQLKTMLQEVDKCDGIKNLLYK
ncbi:SET and MYND domain-containing protein 4-like [Pseudomyrmex gracilis]|uniref:SET and MYND domain-containing protein 4-like n=1 Tax=Pseudomyrmex gracilis TaxID=219809 RepID=UPI000995615B|nr:SET and MYND domain-containing protein 4-like [Pseudomyrmex gracilis]